MITRVIIKKVMFYKGLKSWGGYLLPSEIVSLVEHGVIPTQGSHALVDAARAKLKRGDCRPSWFYFTVPKGSTAHKALY